MVEGVQGYTDPPPGNHIPGCFPIPTELWRMYVISEGKRTNERKKESREREDEEKRVSEIDRFRTEQNRTERE